jgi:hypothetical protein
MRIMNKLRISGATLLLASAIVPLDGCGSGSDDAGLGTGAAAGSGGSIGLDGGPSSGGSGVSSGGKVGSGGAVGSGGGVQNPGGKAPDEPCTDPSECASGRCEPVPMTTDVVCLGACFADGAACTRALDCCSTGCFDGECGGQCTVEGEDCTSDAECCSSNCDTDGRCAVDEANPDCRPTGEDCTSGTSRGCCHACDEATDRCGFPEGTCFAQGVGCMQDSDCCRGMCVENVCRTICTPDDGACATNADCCSATCTDGSCAPPPPADGGGTCVPVGGSCEAASDCCSLVCFGSFCEPTIF